MALVSPIAPKPSQRRDACGLFFYLVCFLALSILSSSASGKRVELSLEDELIVELRLGDVPLPEPLFIFRSPEFTLLPIDAIARALDLPASVDLETLSIQGTNLKSGDQFAVDLLKREIYVEGSKLSWSSQTLYSDDGFDIYVDQQSVQRWFGLSFGVDVGQLRLNVEPHPSIPAVARIAREEAQQSLRLRTVQGVPENYVPNRYKWLGKPQFDFSVGGEGRRNRGDIDYARRMYLQGRGDVLKHSLHGSLIDNDGESDLRLTFSRASEGPDRDIALGFDRYDLGDLFGLSDNLVFSSAQGRGLYISRGAGSSLSQGDTITLQGDAPPGWEVELYRNGNLLEFGRISPDGRYFFENVPVFVGENIFDIRLYGPQGQFREQRETVTTGGNILSQGEWQYGIWAMRKNKRLIDSDINAMSPESDLFMSEVRYGFNRYITGRVGAGEMKPEGSSESRRYGFSNLYASALGTTAQLAHAFDDNSGNAYELALQSRVFETNINLDWTRFDGLVSDRNQSGDLKSEYKLRLDRGFQVGLPNVLQNSLSLVEQENKSEIGQFRASYRASTGWSGFQATNNLDLIDRDEAEIVLNGLFNVSRKWQGWRYKGGIEYKIKPSSRFSALSFGVAGDLASNLVYTANISQRFDGDDVFSADNTFTWQLKHFSLSSSAGFNTDGFQYLGFSISSSLGYDAHTNNHFFTADSRVNNASVRARMYIDENANRVYDEGEQVVPGIRFEGQSKWRKQKSDERGLITLNGLQALTVEKLEIDEKSIEDPFLQVADGPTYFYTHAGSHQDLDIALVQTFELEGMVLKGGADAVNHTAFPGARVELYDEDGLVDTVRSEFDGVFIFTGVVPGSYCVIVKNRKDQMLAQSCFESDGLDGVVFLEDLIVAHGAR